MQIDETDRQILSILQSDCKTSLADIGKRVDLSAPSVNERIRKLEAAGVVRGYRALLDGQMLGLDITAFVGVSIQHPNLIDSFERALTEVSEVLECHHVTGEHSLMLKVKTKNTRSLEALIGELRSLDGVLRTNTMVVLSSLAEKTALPLGDDALVLGNVDDKKGRKKRV